MSFKHSEFPSQFPLNKIRCCPIYLNNSLHKVDHLMSLVYYVDTKVDMPQDIPTYVFTSTEKYEYRRKNNSLK